MKSTRSVSFRAPASPGALLRALPLNLLLLP